MPDALRRREILQGTLLALIVLASTLLPGALLWGEWESFTVYSTFGDATSHLTWAIAPRGNIGGQGYGLLEMSRFIVEHLGIHPTVATLRIPVVVCGALALVIFYVIARRWFGAWAALIATALLAVNPTFSQYQHELIIAGPSLMAFLLILERLQSTAAKPTSWIRWVTLGAASALALLLYGPGRVLAVAVLALWLAKALFSASRGHHGLRPSGLLLRAATAAGTTAALLLLASPSNASFFGPRLLFPRNSENFLVSGSSMSPLDVVLTNVRIVAESLVLGGGSYHSDFLEATLIQGRYVIIPLIMVPFCLAGIALCIQRLTVVRPRLDSPYSAILVLAVLTIIPMLTSSLQLLAKGSVIGEYVVSSDMWQATLVNYRLAYFLVPAYLAIAALAQWALSRHRTAWVAVAVALTLVVLGAAGIVQSRSAFADRVASTDPRLTGDEGLVQWLAGYSTKDKPNLWASHFQQHGQYQAWASQIAGNLGLPREDGSVLIVPTSVSCFPEAPLAPLSLGDIIGRNYHDVFLATYLSNELPEANVGFVFVPPVVDATDIVGEKVGQYSAKLIEVSPGQYDYVDFDAGNAFIRGLAGDDPDVVITTTPTELELAKTILAKQGRAFDVLQEATPCWSDPGPADQ